MPKPTPSILTTDADVGPQRCHALGGAVAPYLFRLLECQDAFALPARACLRDVEAVTIGRRRTRGGELAEGRLSIFAPDRFLSTVHTHLRRTGAGWLLSDAGSKNGTLVGGARVERHLLADGDVFEAGHTFFLFRELLQLDAGPAWVEASELHAPSPGLLTLQPRLEAAFEQLGAVAPSRLPLLIVGDTGTGKELAAAAAHALSGRQGQLRTVSCAAIAPALLESQLFGHQKGAFAGATDDAPGLLRSSDRGTLFLDAISELPLPAQATLLRALQQSEVTPLGGTEAVKIDLRLIAATLRDLSPLVAAGTFRGDLLARLQGFVLQLPRLRERREDLGLLVAQLLRRHAPAAERVTMQPEFARALFAHHWPGNVRELEQALAAALLFAKGEPLALEHLPAAVRSPLPGPSAAEVVEPPPPAEPPKAAVSLLDDLKRRRVFRTLVGYGVVAFALLQIVEPIMHGLHWPDAVLSYVVVGLAVGFPLAVMLAWAFDVNASGIKRTPPSPGLRGPRLALLLLGIGVFAATPGVAWYFFSRRAPVAVEPVKLDPAIASLPSIAVLPLVNMSSDKEQEYFSDGLSEELLNLLAQLPQLRVIARTSSFSFKGKEVDVATIAKALDVANILEGSVRKSGNKLRVTAQLIRTADSSHLWSQTYDRELTDVFKVQDEIASAVVAALKVHLVPSQAVSNPHRTASTEAYEQYLLGQQIARRASYGELPAGIAALQKAVALDPTFAAAYAALATLQIAAGQFVPTLKKRSAFEQAGLASVEKSLAIDPSSGEALLVRAWYRCKVAFDWKGGEEDLERGRALEHGFTISIVLESASGNACFRPSRLQSELERDRKLVAADPLGTTAWQLYGTHLLLLPNGLKEARAAIQRAVDLSPDAGWSRTYLGLLDLEAGDAQGALSNFRGAGPGLSLAGIAMAEHSLGHEQESQQALIELKTKFSAGQALQVAWVYAWRGERDLAFEWLDRAYVQRDAGLARLRYERPLKSLRDDSRFAALVAKLGLPE